MSSGEADAWRGTRRDLDPPLPVWIRLSAALQSGRIPRSDAPLRVRAGGLDLSATIPGTLYSWHQTSTGIWRGLCEVTIPNRHGAALHLPRQLIPEIALQPAYLSPMCSGRETS